MTNATAAAEPVEHQLPMLGLVDVTVRFGGITALDSVAFTVAPGAICGLIGPNGAGKTTLFDVISGMRAPSTGSVALDGIDVSRMGVPQRSRLGLRRTFQRVQTFGWLSVEDNVLTALEWRGGGGGFLADLVASPTRRRRQHARRDLVDITLERCGLTDVRSELAGSLPIGIARMVELARATVEHPKLLMLDEPASGLDDAETARLGAHIQTVRSESGCAVLLVEHNANFVMELSDRIVVLDLGAVLADGTPQEIQTNPAVQAAYLGDSETHSDHHNDQSTNES